MRKFVVLIGPSVADPAGIMDCYEEKPDGSRIWMSLGLSNYIQNKLEEMTSGEKLSVNFGSSYGGFCIASVEEYEEYKNA